METLQVPEHEKIFTEICNKLNELSQTEETKTSKDRVAQLEKMQNQLKNFQYDLVTNHEDMKLKIEALESMTVSNSDLTQKVQELTLVLNQERTLNSKLSTDLARSLDLSLKLQLEIQEIKTKAMQAQMEERKQYMENFAQVQQDFQKQKQAMLTTSEQLAAELKNRDAVIEELNQKINELETGLTSIESQSQEQGETIKHLMTVAENKIVELKLSLDRAVADKDNMTGQIKQTITQVEIFKQENYALKDYINKMTEFQKQMISAQQG